MDKIRIKLDDGAFPPSRAHMEDAGLDLYSPVWGVIKPGKSMTIDTGVHAEIPVGYAGFLKSKSGLNVHMGVQSEGVIDAGYTGSIVVKLYNHGNQAVEIRQGDKISQIVILPVALPGVEIVERIGGGERANEGFGSTGR